LLYNQESIDELKRIEDLFGPHPIQRIRFTPNAAFVGYNVSDVVCVTFTTTAAAAPLNAPETFHRMQLGDAYRKVAAQIRQTEEYTAAHRYRDEPTIEEEDFEYPKLRQISTQGIRRLIRDGVR